MNKRTQHSAQAFGFTILAVGSAAFAFSSNNLDKENSTKIEVGAATLAVVSVIGAVSSAVFACFPDLPDKITKTISGCTESMHNKVSTFFTGSNATEQPATIVQTV